MVSLRSVCSPPDPELYYQYGTFMRNRFSEGSGLLHHEEGVYDFDNFFAELSIDGCHSFLHEHCANMLIIKLNRVANF